MQLRGGGAFGNGFLLDGSRVVTCAHVVAEILGRGCHKCQPDRPDGVVELAFTFSSDRQLKDARVVEGGWFPAIAKPDGVFDIAVLELLQPPPPDAKPLQVASADRTGFRVKLKPYLSDLRDEGRSLTFPADVIDATEFNELQINAVKGHGQWVQDGVSGAPVFAEDEGFLVQGLVAWRDRQERQAFMKPPSALRAALAKAGAERSAEGPRYHLEVDEDTRNYANGRLVGFDVYAPSQAAHPGEGIAVHLDLNFERFPSGASWIREVEVELTPPDTVTERLGQAVPVERGVATIHAKGDRRRPYWRISASEGSLSDVNIPVEQPPLCRLAEPSEGDRVGAVLVTYANCDHAMQVPDDIAALDVSDMKARILERLRLKDIGEPDDEGRILLGRLTSVVKVR